MKTIVKYLMRITLYVLLFLGLISFAVTTIFFFFPHSLWVICRWILVASGFGVGLFCIVTLARILLFFLNREQKNPPSGGYE